MREKIMWKLKQLHISLEQYGRLQMKEMELSPTQGIVLQYLLSAGQEPIYAVDLHEALGVSKPTISATLTALREKGYVQLEGNPEDDRKKQILLTDKAVAMGEKLDASLQWQERQLCRGISSQRLKNLEEDLTMMLANVRRETGWEENL